MLLVQWAVFVVRGLLSLKNCCHGLGLNLGYPIITGSWSCAVQTSHQTRHSIRMNQDKDKDSWLRRSYRHIHYANEAIYSNCDNRSTLRWWCHCLLFTFACMMLRMNSYIKLLCCEEVIEGALLGSRHIKILERILSFLYFTSDYTQLLVKDACLSETQTVSIWTVSHAWTTHLTAIRILMDFNTSDAVSHSSVLART